MKSSHSATPIESPPLLVVLLFVPAVLALLVLVTTATLLAVLEGAALFVVVLVPVPPHAPIESSANIATADGISGNDFGDLITLNKLNNSLLIFVLLQSA